MQASEPLSSHIIGWSKVNYIQYLDTKDPISYLIESEKKLNEILRIFHKSRENLNPLLPINLKERNFILLYRSVSGINYFFGIEKIEQVTAEIKISCADFNSPGLGTTHIGGQIVLLSTPKNIKNISVQVRKMEVKEEQEYANFDQEIYNKLCKSLNLRNSITSNIIRRDLVLEETMQQQKWFQDLPPTKKIEASEILTVYREYSLWEEAFHKAFDKLQERLLGKPLFSDSPTSNSSCQIL